MTQPDLEKLANECASVIVWPHYETNSHGYRAECIAVKRRLMEFLERANEGLRGELVAKDEMLKGAWGHELPCYFCGTPCSCIAANPSKWPIPLCHSDEPGKVKVHHIGCVMERLVERDELRAQPIAPAPGVGEELLGECALLLKGLILGTEWEIAPQIKSHMIQLEEKVCKHLAAMNPESEAKK